MNKPTAIEVMHQRRMLPWHQRAVALVSGSIANAEAHAENAVTQSLKETPDGRASLTVVRRNPSFKAALARLDELWEAIGGPAVTSLDGLVQDCAESCYVQAWLYWRRNTPIPFRRPGNIPTAAQRTYVRGLLWFGQPIRAAFEPPFKRAKVTLSSAIHAAGSAEEDMAALKTWADQQKARLIQAVGKALNDANVRADRLAQIDVVDPKHLTDEAKAKGTQ